MNLKLLTATAAAMGLAFTITPIFGQGGNTGASTAGQSAVERDGKAGAQPATPSAGTPSTSSPGASSATGGSAQPVDDTLITTRVKARMATDKSVSATSINVKTVNGVVELSGTAKSKAEADQAASIARGIDGVKSVNNMIQVAGAAPAARDSTPGASSTAPAPMSGDQMARSPRADRN